MDYKVLNQLNTGLEWQQLDFDTIVSIISTHADIDPAWPHEAWQCSNLIQLDFKLQIHDSLAGEIFLRISNPYTPITHIYLLQTGGMLLNPSGTCSGWEIPGEYYVHVVYAFN